MSLCSHVLFDCLVSDLSRILNTLPKDAIPTRNIAWPGITGQEFACLSLADSLLKKFKDEKAADADTKALAKFLEFNTRCAMNSSIDHTNITEIEEIAVGEARNRIYDFWLTTGGQYNHSDWEVTPFEFSRTDQDEYILNEETIASFMDVGPGASIGASGNSFYEKLGASPLTGTRKSLYSLYKREAGRYSLWSETEKIRSAKFGEFVPVEGSRISFAPKTREISRTICTEPLLNMFVQKGIGSVIERELDKRFGINLSSQPERNRTLARIGSETGTFGTIDLSSASDSISLGMLREVLPPYIYSWILEARSPSTQLPDGSTVQLHMVSSMGNGFTFPLQTMVFSSIVLGVYSALNLKAYRPTDPRSNWAVFGDDIIVEARAYDLVIRTLERFGFVVNKDKSYNYGPFRESCGSDYLSGYNVRGIYCQSIKTVQDLYSLINRLNVWSANHDVPLPLTVSYLASGIRGQKLLVPAWENDTAGLKVPLKLVPFVKLRYGANVPQIAYTRYMARGTGPDLINIERRPVKRKGWYNNHPCILLAAVSGRLRDGRIIERTDRPYYKKQIAIAPSWDYVDPCHSPFLNDGWLLWLNTVVEENLSSGFPSA